LRRRCSQTRSALRFALSVLGDATGCDWLKRAGHTKGVAHRTHCVAFVYFSRARRGRNSPERQAGHPGEHRSTGRPWRHACRLRVRGAQPWNCWCYCHAMNCSGLRHGHRPTTRGARSEGLTDPRRASPRLFQKASVSLIGVVAFWIVARAEALSMGNPLSRSARRDEPSAEVGAGGVPAASL
jgi:hypothetical protein